MNEKMLELARKAGLKKDHGSDREYLGDFDWREFGEMLVRECMVIAKSQRDPHTLNYKPSERFVEDLKRHFGVKDATE